MQSITPPAAISFVGMGVMGAAMAANIAKAGFALTVASRSRDKAAALEAGGARWAASAAEAARGAACVALCVPDTPDVEAVLFGPGGVAEAAAPGTVVIDFSTIAAGATASFAQRLLAERGAHLLDSPVSGGPQGAIDGTLTCMVGGDPAAFAAAAAVFRAVGKTVTHLGPSGSGQVCKAANQLIITATMQAVFEALAMGRKAGLDPATMREALLGGSAKSAVLENHAQRLLDGKFTPGFRAELMRKDMRLAVAAMRDFGVHAPVTAVAAQQMEATCNTGRASLDVVALGLLVNELAGLGD
ncbi:MAG: NAD(P)-dependent oxidoreductase [Acetobacteraceae bacterium]|nr:NAD(P)-dependent oxidoreductase [Acetobacteraceae bacterium]